jgi:hypothetical protein
MSSRTGFRIAAVVFLIFAIGHTAGFLTFRPATAEGQAVWRAMNDVRFGASASDIARFSYGNFYVGFGLSITALQLFQGYLSWLCGNMAARGLRESRMIGAGLAALQVVGTVLGFKYFSIAPAIFSIALALLLSWSCTRASIAGKPELH